MLRAVPADARIVALSVAGRAWTTEQLAARLEGWEAESGAVAFLIGGPDGLAPDCEARADEFWSLSSLTLPHGLARIVVAEALYRAWSLNRGHPYHRA
jgi:23S rRNA (pseudouridine1915-N3)-methyltransferase